MSQEEKPPQPAVPSEYIFPEEFLLSEVAVSNSKKPISQWAIGFAHDCLKDYTSEEQVKRLIDCICTGDIKCLSYGENQLRNNILSPIAEQFSAIYSEEERRTLPSVLRPVLEESLKHINLHAFNAGFTASMFECIENIPSPVNPKDKDMVTVDYDTHRPWGKTGKPSDNRPYEEVVLKKLPGGKDVRLWCLVDTGADHLQVESPVAKKLGINLTTSGTPISIMTASGSTSTITEISNLDIEIEGSVIDAKCYFGANKTPILGRVTILALLEIGFDINGWLLKQ